MPGETFLERWYSDNLGDPLEPDHVYGYWTFVLAAAMAVAALGFLLLSTRYPESNDLLWFNRRLAFTLVLLTGPVIGLSVVYLLPLQRRATRLALAGLVICLLATAAFNWAYPFAWNAGADQSTWIVTVYGAGIALQVLTVVAHPMVSDETAQPGAASAAAGGSAAGADEGATDSRATFQLYEDRGGEHRWRLRHDNGDVIADSGEGYSSRSKARQGLRSVQTNAPGADVVEPED